MGKIGILTATLAAAAICVGGLVFYLFHWPKILQRNTALLAFIVEEGLTTYADEHATVPAGSPTDVIAALLGENRLQKSYLRPEFREFLDANGAVLDSWKQPFRFDRRSDGSIKLRSAGPNGRFEDADDLTSDSLN